jgi:hypothetical protein
MKYIMLLTLLFTSTAFAVDPTLVRQSFGTCYYDDGSVIKSMSCSSRLSTGSSTSSRPNGLLMSDESVDWRLNFGKQQADAVSSAFTPSMPSAQNVRVQQQRSAATAKQRTDFADYVSKTYGQEGAALRGHIMSGVINSTNYQLFVD